MLAGEQNCSWTAHIQGCLRGTKPSSKRVQYSPGKTRGSTQAVQGEQFDHVAYSLTKLVCLRACAVKAGCSPYSQGSSEEEKAGSLLPDNKLHANNSIRLLCLYCWTSSLGELIGNDVKIAQAQPFCISSSKKDCRSWTLNHWRLAGRAANDWASCWSLQS